MTKIHINRRDVFSYPDKNTYFNPSESYPEYKWKQDSISIEKNEIYDMLRQSLYFLDLDKENFGSENWNPFKDIIKPGQTVLLKPNIVLHRHNDLDCVITHPSLVRATIDYVCIALNNTGKIIIGDAPLQSCNFEYIKNNVGYKEILEFYSNKNTNIELIDFRNFISDINRSIGEYNVVTHKDDNNMYCVDFLQDSLLDEVSNKYKQFRVTNYDHRLMKKYHNKKHHKYLIRDILLQADVIITMPKPKTHRKAGFTAALKNNIGTVVHKHCLPHHTKGSKENGNDEYLKASFLKCLRYEIIQKIDICNFYNKKGFIKIWKKLLGKVQKIINKTHKCKFYEGSWYGNDTIWRTFGDLTRALIYTDKNGNLQKYSQRKFFIIADMIISGEREGPLEPSRKNQGMIVAGDDFLAFDSVISKIMGFDYKKIPGIYRMFNIIKYSISNIRYEDIIVSSNDNKLDNIRLKDADFSHIAPFYPTLGWKGHIEDDDRKQDYDRLYQE